MRERRAGFTLLEVLLALAILSALFTAAYAMLFSTISAREHVEAVSDATASAQSLAWLLREELRGTLVTGEAAGVFTGTALPPPEGALLTFVTVSNPLARSEGGGIFQVSYRLDPNAEERDLVDLMRSQTPWSNGTQEEPVFEPVFRRLRSCRVAFFNGAVWATEWPESQGQVAQGVRFTLELAPVEGAASEPVQATVWIPASMNQGTGGGQ